VKGWTQDVQQTVEVWVAEILERYPTDSSRAARAIVEEMFAIFEPKVGELRDPFPE
jgi:hypothetical protein